MVKILLSCVGGITSSLLADRMEEEAKSRGLECKVWATNQYGIRENLGKFDIVMVGPQIPRFVIDEIVEGKYPVEDIDMFAYSNLDAKQILDSALKACEEFYQ